MSMFSADDIMDMEVAGEMSTEYTPVPEGEYAAAITSVKVRMVGEEKDKPVLDIVWGIDDERVRQELGIEKPSCRQSIFLDLNESGRLDLSKGKNVQLGKLREAVGQNGAGPWAIPHLDGAAAIVKISHREYNGSIYADVKGVAAL